MAMTKLTGLDLFILTDTLLHSLAHEKYWTGAATKEARNNVLKKLEKIMSEMGIGLPVEEGND
jgi:hypothetical protein